MNEKDSIRVQDILQDLTDLIEHKDSEIARLKEKEKEAFDMGLSEGREYGMKQAWETADDIVHLKWDGAYVKPKTVEEWFEMYTAEEAQDALRACKMQKERPHWVADFERNNFECSSCKHRSRIASPYCPWCGKEMEDLQYEL